jgi:hypothetical protein
LIITDFGFRRSYGALGRVAIGANGAEDQVEFGCQGNLDGLNASGAGNLEIACETAFQANVGNDFLGSAVLVNDFSLAGGRQVANLVGFIAEIDRAGLELQVELDRFALEVEDFEFQGMSLMQEAGSWKQIGDQWE